jgi:hypothetical protein
MLGEIFSPDRPLRDPSALFGRDVELREILIAYSSSQSSVPVVSGPPGIGKSSLLAVLRQVLIGYSDVLQARGLAGYAPPMLNRLVIVQQCDSSLSDESALSRAILTNMERVFVERSSRRIFNLNKSFEAEIGLSLGFSAIKEAWMSVADDERKQTATEVLSARLGALTAVGELDEVCVLLDECEQIPWLERLLSYTRRFHAGETRFCIATRDHVAHRMATAAAGDYRWPRHIPVSPLNIDQVRELYSAASNRLAGWGIPWQVTTDAMEYISHHSGGEPWYLQMIGEGLIFDSEIDLVKAVSTGEIESIFVSRMNVSSAEQWVLKRHLIGLHAQRYSDLCRRSPQREEVVRALAKFPGMNIPDRFVGMSRIGRAKAIVRELSKGADPVLVRVPTAGSWQFAQHQFRVYCRLVPPFIEAVDAFADLHVNRWRATT